MHPELSISLAQVPSGLRAGLCLLMLGGMHCQCPMKNKQLSRKDREAAWGEEAVVLSVVKDVGKPEVLTSSIYLTSLKL